jgi:alpha-tubulin suppressor-like RCC1 family protein
VPYPTLVGFSTMNVGTITAVATGAYFSCALTSNHTVWCWGANDLGQLGNPAVAGDTNVPQEVNLGQGIQAMELAAGDDHACVVTAGYSVRCWGDDSYGQLGVGGNVQGFAVPVQVQRTSTAALKDALHVAAGGNTTCVTRALDSQVWCWGANDWGQAGQPTSNQPVIEYATAMSL